MSRNDKVFSVITPVYNGAEFLQETLDSVLKYCNDYSFEYIVVNDGSTDQTSQILTKYADRIVVVDIINQGEANAVNTGLKMSTGKYCLVVSADDPLLSSELFNEALIAFQNDPSLVAVYPDWNVIDSDSHVVSQVQTMEYSKQALLEYFVCIPGPGTIFRTSVAKEIGGRNISFKYVSDYDFWLRLSEFGDFKRIPRVLAQWRNHANSTSISNKGLEMAEERIRVVENFLQLFPQPKSIENSALAHAHYNASLLAYFSNDVPGARWMLKAIRFGKGRIEKADLRIILFCLLLPFSRYILPLLKRLPIIRGMLKRRKNWIP